MLALFSLRLAFGMLACLPLLPARAVQPRFYRTHLLTALGLTIVALVSSSDRADTAVLVFLSSAVALTLFGSILWRVEGAPGGYVVNFLALLALAAGVWNLEITNPTRTIGPGSPSIFVGDIASAAVLGTSMSAMLMGHSYLIAPGMSLSPLFRLLSAFFIAVFVRMATDGFVLGRWSTENSFAGLGNDTLLWLPVRWLVGFFVPLALAWMAWQSARIRSTQSATGILYVVVICCFLGELISLLLRDTAGLTL